MNTLACSEAVIGRGRAERAVRPPTGVRDDNMCYRVTVVMW